MNEPEPALVSPSDGENSPLYIVGIGASAGGLEAIEKFFDNMPNDSGLAFVVVQHLSPDFKSLMDELLARHTTMTIHRVYDGIVVEPDSIYLIPSKSNMSLANGRLLLSEQKESNNLKLPIDIFFVSMAQDATNNAIAVVLSGTGSDGSRGIREVHNSGGLVLVQDVESSGFDGMPRSAAATGVADVIISPDRMPQKILEYVKHPSTFNRGQRGGDETTHGSGDLSHLFRIFRQRYGIDFALYKPATINRRLERRMQLSQIDDLADYIHELENDTDELDLLYRDLLVEVTHFFRDPEAFEILRNDVIPKIIDRKDRREELRVWVPGCATGEEAYTLAILLRECGEAMGRNLKTKIFASDVHQTSLETASNGLYAKEAIQELPQQLFNRYFNRESDQYRVVPEIRQSVVFAMHDITKDPPFTKIDLLSCRNVLIYLEPEAQQRTLAMFHFALKREGIMFLGPSETTGTLSKEFDMIDQTWRIYRKIRDVRLPEMNQMSMSAPMLSVVRGRMFGGKPTEDPSWLVPSAFEDLLAKYVPPSLLVNEFYDIVHTFGEARRFLVQPVGRPTINLLKMVEGDLKAALTAGLHQSGRKEASVSYSGVEIPGSGEKRFYKIVVEPYKKNARKLFFVSFEEEKERPPRPVADDAKTFNLEEQNDDRIIELERELDYTRESLQTTVEELETSNEELQSTNEELIASNEELQSTNEELHSVNEELYTVNAEHQRKIEELTVVNNDLNNLMKSTEIGTIFLDSELRIRRFTPAIVSAFHVVDHDIGRPISHIAYNIDNPELIPDIQNVLASGEMTEKEVTSREGRIYLKRIQPYRSASNNIEGVILTFDDITNAKAVANDLGQAERDLDLTQQELQEFAYAVSHDLQSPLRHIEEHTGLLAEQDISHLSEESQHHLKVISDSSRRMHAMIESLLNYSRIESRGKPFESVSSEDVMDQALVFLKPTLEQYPVEVTRESLPVLHGDRDQLVTVFQHLIENAAKYSGDQSATVHISAKREGKFWLFSVDDNGIGIERRHFDRVFVIFQRLGFKPEVPGMGEGLAICRRIIERHYGWIWCESEGQRGTTFYFKLPTADGQR